MRTWWKRVVGAAALLLVTALPASAAITWLVVNDADCSGSFAAAGLSGASIPCCRTSAAAGGANFCSYRQNVGTTFVRQVTFTVGGASAYTATGDALNATALSKIGLQNVTMAFCQGASTGQDVNWIPTAPTTGYAYGAKLQLFQTGAGGTTPVTNGGEFVGSLTNATISCVLFGY